MFSFRDEINKNWTRKWIGQKIILQNIKTHQCKKRNYDQQPTLMKIQKPIHGKNYYNKVKKINRKKEIAMVP